MKRVEAKIVGNVKENPTSEPDEDPNTWLIEAKLEEDVFEWENVQLDFRGSEIKAEIIETAMTEPTRCTVRTRGQSPLKSPTHVRLLGKGRKERISPLWPETAEVITALLRRSPRRADEPLFVNRYGEPLTASGFRFRLRQYVNAAAQHVPTISRKRITPHIFRHTTAVHLVAAGVDVTVIRSWMGHAQLDTTNHYAQANLETKRKALEQVDPKFGRRNRRGGSGTLICWRGWIRCDDEHACMLRSFTACSYPGSTDRNT